MQTIQMTTKLFVQLQPDQNGLGILHDIQQQLDNDLVGRLVTATSMHMTVLHIGLVERLVSSIRPWTDASEDQILQSLTNLVESWQISISQLNFSSVDLSPVGIDRFGENHGTLVVRLSTTAALRMLHKNCLGDFMYFLGSIGVDDPRRRMSEDANLKHCLALSPHISLAKGYRGSLPTVSNEQSICLSIMPLVYDH